MRNSYLPRYATFFLLIAGGCSYPTGKPAPVKDSVMTVADSSAKTHSYPVAMVDNKKDPSCGMPVTAGIGDTVHYAGKVIGFCSKECKDDFMKDPVAAIKKTEFKK